jgi:hypothetical protein
MGCGKIYWGKIGGVFSLKALALAFFLTPATVAVPQLATPALAQIGIYLPIPGIRFYGDGGRRYRGGGGRSYHSRHHSHGGGGQESDASPSAPAPGKGPRGTSD